MASKQVKITDEELNAIKQVRVKYEQIMFQIGQTEIQIRDTEKLVENLTKQRETLHTEYAGTQNEEKSLFEQLSKKYGMGSINIDSGVITQEVPDEPK
jgi:hypothetical protein